MATIYVDDRPYEVDPARNLLEECLSKGLDLPYFCWHPALGSVGACRQCAVKQYRDENDQRGRIVMACMTPAMDGARFSIRDKDAAQFRAGIVELLMSNHPHDCPVCDEGGECHLQDMTVMTGHNYRGYRFGKRTFTNQQLGPFINHEMNRCITCYRCVRYYRDHAGGKDLDAFASHNHVYFGRHEDGALENEFSGNLVEVCPTGVFTDKTLKEHYTRKWDLQTAPSVCVHCSLGCNTIAGERYGGLRRILNRYNAQVNGYFLCDRGRFGYGFVNGDRRLRQPRMLQDGESRPVSGADALKRTALLLGRQSRVIGIGSPRASMEANFALRALVGPPQLLQRHGPGRGALGGAHAARAARRRGAHAVAARGGVRRRGAGAGRGRHPDRADAGAGHPPGGEAGAAPAGHAVAHPALGRRRPARGDAAAEGTAFHRQPRRAPGSTRWPPTACGGRPTTSRGWGSRWRAPSMPARRR